MRAAHRAAVLALAFLCGCSSHEDVRVRYRLERMMWQAQFYQRRVNIAFMGATASDTQRAIQAYRAVVAADPFAGGPRPDWDAGVAADIRTVIVSARVALANLYFASERYTDAGTLYAETVELGSMNFKDALDARMGAARASYMEGDEARVIDQCARIFHAVRESPEFWAGKGALDEMFLNIPVALVRLHHDAGDTVAADSAAADAVSFYARVTDTWPGSRLDWQSRLAVAQVHMLRGEWSAAAEKLDAIVSDVSQQAGDAATLELVLGEVYAFRLGRPDIARARFQSIRTRYPGTVAFHAAAYDLAAVRLAEPDARGAAEEFRALERAPGVPPSVASRAMLSRAKILEASGRWDDAYALLRRLEQTHPYTTAAIEAPLVVTRHYVETGNTAMIQVAVDHANEYYQSLLDRRSAFPGNRFMVQAALAESFMASGRAGDAARVLGTGPAAWDDVSAAAGMLKAAEIYHTVLANSRQARAVLEQVIERFPNTRYERTARQRLDELPPAD